jgi:adenylosuccinate lyase
MRMAGEENPYEKLKAVTRGKTGTSDRLNELVDNLENVSEKDKARMKKLTPGDYIGVAEELVDLYFSTCQERSPE